ncbi:unnamed protein product [Lymnaea stagnalis]|uniref:Deoxyribonuclease n=1 Tax=Lymnaea stagnalis TaxID=6523 RepID=A0AAV2HJ26_LYMST
MMSSTSYLVILTVTVLTLQRTCGQRRRSTPLSVAAFNIKGFGRAKMSNRGMAGNIVKIVSRYDVILIQEVRDTTGYAVDELWRRLNATDSWGLLQSEPIGRTSYKEQYAFFYRTNLVKITGSYQYNDDARDIFEREPFAIEIEYYSIARSAKNRIVLLALHTRPQDTVEELKTLPQAMRVIYQRFRRAKGIIAMGDFNADCGYLNNAMKKEMEIFRGDFVSLIPDTTDTTVAEGTHCAYDRAVVLGKDVTVSDAQVYDFTSDLGLDLEEAYEISDHFPIEFNLH